MQSLRQTLFSAGIESAMLDDMVHDASDREATRVNDGGIKDQLEYLERIGLSESEILKELDVEPPKKEMKLLFISDPGHAWLKVPHQLLSKLKVDTSKISSYSYRDSQYAYLEEDDDANIVIAAAWAAGYEVIIQEKHEEISSIRPKQPYC